MIGISIGRPIIGISSGWSKEGDFSCDGDQHRLGIAELQSACILSACTARFGKEGKRRNDLAMIDWYHSALIA